MDFTWKRVERFEEAVRAHAFRGTKEPYEERHEIDLEYEEAKNDLIKWIDELVERKNNVTK